MARSHPPSLLRSVETTLVKRCGFESGARILVAVSGGPDSMALCHALGLLRERLDFRLLAVSVDHGLREESPREVELVADFCLKQSIPFESCQLGLAPGSNVQERARKARYEALEQTARRVFGDPFWIATAHHREDRAETVLLRLLRGTSLEGLNVLPPRVGQRIRPLIDASRRDVLLHLERHGVPWVEDPSNRDGRFLRVRVRSELLPLLMELAPGSIDHLVELAEEAAALPEPLGLNREQRRQIRQALQDPRIPVNLRLPGGLVVSREKRSKS